MEWNRRDVLGIDMKATSENISRLIDQSGFSDKELSDIMGLSVQSINKWRHGKNLPDIENLYILSRLVGVTLDEMVVQQSRMRVVA